MCDKGGCKKCYHKTCLGSDVNTRGKWICPWHFCDDCGKWANIMCSECPNSYCRSHASGQITELANGVHLCCDHIVTRNSPVQNQAFEEEKVDHSKPSADVELSHVGLEQIFLSFQDGENVLACTKHSICIIDIKCNNRDWDLG